MQRHTDFMFRAQEGHGGGLVKKERIKREYRNKDGRREEQPASPLASPHLRTPSASTCMPSLLKQPIIVVLIRALLTGGRGRVLLWRVAR